jgi:hypothetical protein
MRLPWGDQITIERAERAIDIILAVIITASVFCVALAAYGALTMTASVAVGTIVLLIWLLAGALWLWYT